MRQTGHEPRDSHRDEYRHADRKVFKVSHYQVMGGGIEARLRYVAVGEYPKVLSLN
jgi:hypothetical protein